VLCVSVNDAVVHGIPNGYALQDGDVISVDFGATLRGWTGDAARSFIVGTPRPEDAALIDAADKALAAGIAAVRPGNTLGDVGHAIGSAARGAGYGLLADHGGHGIGRTMHEDPHVPNEGRPGKGMRLRPGLVIAIEPMSPASGWAPSLRGECPQIATRTDAYVRDPDGWTLRTASSARGAQRAHRRRHGGRCPHPYKLTLIRAPSSRTTSTSRSISRSVVRQFTIAGRMATWFRYTVVPT
jgi:methionyl aminopeptidase